MYLCVFLNPVAFIFLCLLTTFSFNFDVFNEDIRRKDFQVSGAQNIHIFMNLYIQYIVFARTFESFSLLKHKPVYLTPKLSFFMLEGFQILITHAPTQPVIVEMHLVGVVNRILFFTV